MNTIETLREHSRILWALMLRELATRYGRDNLGFLWVVFEPLTFCVGVLILWRTIRGPYENGISVLPFVLTGYMPTILVRHIVMYSLNAVKINGGLLYHRSITVLDLFVARILLEIVGVTVAFSLIYVLMLIFQLAPIPANIGLVYVGWFTTAFVGAGMAMMIGAITEMVEVVERIISVALYILVPLSGTFFLADWLPPDARRFALMLPFLNCAEMVRSGFFGSSIVTHYNLTYTLEFAAVMMVIGLLVMRHVRATTDMI